MLNTVTLHAINMVATAQNAAQLDNGADPNMNIDPNVWAGAGAGIGFGLLLILLLIGFLLAVIQLAGLWKMFSKAGQPGILAIIPIVNIFFPCTGRWKARLVGNSVSGSHRGHCHAHHCECGHSATIRSGHWNRLGADLSPLHILPHTRLRVSTVECDRLSLITPRRSSSTPPRRRMQEFQATKQPSTDGCFVRQPTSVDH